MAAAGLVHVNVSVTTLDAALARSMEPRAASPQARLAAIRGLSEAGVPVRVLVAPVIPGLTDSEIPAILAAAKEAGASAAGYTMLRLPLTVAPVFREWLSRTRPDSEARVEGRIRGVRGGRLNDPEFGTRMTGTGEMARQIGGTVPAVRQEARAGRRPAALRLHAVQTAAGQERAGVAVLSGGVQRRGRGMTERQWLRSTDLGAMMAHVGVVRAVGEREMRLFAAACCRSAWGSLASRPASTGRRRGGGRVRGRGRLLGRPGGRVRRDDECRAGGG